MPLCSAKLVSCTSLYNLVYGIRFSRNSQESMDSVEFGSNDPDLIDAGDMTVLGPKDRALIERCLQNDEGSVFEHLVYQFQLSMPRSVLQEFARHRIGVSMTVESSRFVLNKLIEEHKNDLRKLLYSDEFTEVNVESLKNIYNALLQPDVTSDTVKTLIPEGLMTKVFCTINARALNHMFRLRSRKKVYPPFRQLMRAMFNEVPESHRFLYFNSYRGDA